MDKLFKLFFLIWLLWGCGSSTTTDRSEQEEKTGIKTGISDRFQYVTLLGDTVLTPENPSDATVAKYKIAKLNYTKNPASADYLIWYGRRAAYLGKYDESIKIFTEGISKHPNEARFYRHRGHRYITIRQFQKAISDFEKAVELIADQPDQIEPDGIPNKLNTPVSTLHSNIWYHLGLAYYLENDFTNASRCYQECSRVSTNDDMIVSTAHWYYMTLKRLNKTEVANAVIAEVNSDMSIIENESYQKLCLFYKGQLTEDDLQNTESGNPSNDAVLYGLGNWFLYNNEPAKAKQYFEKIISNGNKASFGFITAENDYKREFL